MRSAFDVLQRNGRYVGTAFGLFLVGWVIGAIYTEELRAFLELAMQNLKDIAEKIQAKQDPLYTSQVIFWNNLRAALMMLLLGIPLCILTVFMLVMNGMVVGAVVNAFGPETGVGFWEMMVFGLLPHGVFELPALFIAAAFGLKLGKVLLVPLEGKGRLESFGFVWLEVLKVSWVIVLLLVVAAGVEGTVTPVLLETFVREP